MITRIYDQNGKLLNSKAIKSRSEERWENLFLSVSRNKCESKSQYRLDGCTLKLNRTNTSKNRHKKSSNTEKTNKKSFEIPDFVIELKDEEDENNNENSEISATPNRTQNQLKISSEDPADDKKVYKLQIGVADFAKKVKDNEGMGISTFTNEEDAKDIPNNENNVSGGTKPKDIKSLIRTEHFIKMAAIATSIRKERSNIQRTPIEKFLHGVRMTMLFMKTIRTSSQETERKNKKYLTFADYQEPQNEKKPKAMFDITYYKAKKESTLSPEAIEVLRINPKMRTPDMIHIALVAVNSTVEAFGEFPISMQMSLINRGWYERFESKRIIIRQGHSALNFYFIMSGITTVSVSRINKSTGESYSETVAFLKKGNSFGELALMFGGKRSATVSCKTDVELLAVSREDFIDIFMSVSGKDEPEHIRFLRELPLLSQWPIDELPYDDPSICLFTYFRRGTVLCHDSNFGNWVYIVKSGTCRILKLVQLSPQEQMDKIQTYKESKLYLAFQNNNVNRNSKKNSKDEIPAHEVRLPKAYDGKYYIQLKILNVGSIFGLEPMAFEFVGGTTGVTLVSDGAELIAIEVKFFQKHLTRQYQSWLRKELQPFPSIENLKGKLKNFYHWGDYKESIIRAIVFDKLNY